MAIMAIIEDPVYADSDGLLHLSNIRESAALLGESHQWYPV